MPLCAKAAEAFVGGKGFCLRSAFLRIMHAGKDFAPASVEVFEPGLVFGAELRFQLFTKTMRERRAGATGRDGDLQGTASHQRGIIKIAKGRIVDDVTQNTAATSFGGDRVIHVQR